MYIKVFAIYGHNQYKMILLATTDNSSILWRTTYVDIKSFFVDWLIHLFCIFANSTIEIPTNNVFDV